MTVTTRREQAMTSTTTSAAPRELAFRAADGLEVALLWHPDSNVVTVAVADARTGESFELALGERDRPLDVFEHPYAYAAYRGLEVGAGAREAVFAAAA